MTLAIFKIPPKLADFVFLGVFGLAVGLNLTPEVPVWRIALILVLCAVLAGLMAERRLRRES